MSLANINLKYPLIKLIKNSNYYENDNYEITI